MLSDTEGIVLKTTKTSYGRTMVLLFSRRYGKISAGTNLGERNRGKNSLAIRPFTLGRYELFKGRETYNINSAEVIKSYYRIGENVDKYLLGAYVLEFTEKALAEDVPSQGIFTSLIDFFDLLEKRDLEGLQRLMEHHLDESKETCLAAVRARNKLQNK